MAGLESPDNKVQDPELGLYSSLHSNTIIFDSNRKGLLPDPVVQVQELGVSDEVEEEQVESLMTLEVLEVRKVHLVVQNNGVHCQRAVHLERMHHPHQCHHFPEEY